MLRRVAWTMAMITGLVGVSAYASAEPQAQALVRDTTRRVLEVLRRDKAEIRKDPQHIYQIVDDIILPHFDFTRMSQRVLGKYWPRATPDQQSRFVKQFQMLLVRTYATALREYTDQVIDFLPPRQHDDEISVRTQIKQSGGPPIPINYEMYHKSDGWKVYDVAIDGVSLVINYRSTFSSEIRHHGIDALIQRLAKHNAADSASK